MVPHVPTAVGTRHTGGPRSPATTPGTTGAATGRAHLRARRAKAFAVGESRARRREISADAYLFLYKELVGLAGDRTYCWPSLEYLCVTLETSAGTLKRWMRELERADLIRRKPRPGGQTSLTYITAYLGPEPERAGDAYLDGEHSEEVGEQRGVESAPSVDTVADTGEAVPFPVQDIQRTQLPIFFAHEQEIISDQPARSEVIPPTVKSRSMKKPGGCRGGADEQQRENGPHAVIDDAVIRLLAAEGVADPEAIAQLQDKPREELHALSGYLDKQTNVRCRPGLFVWLARQDFGATLLAGRNHGKDQRTRHSGQPLPVATDDPRTYLVPAQQPDPVPLRLAEVWQRVLDHLRPALPPSDYETWIEPCTLLALDDGLAVVATPHIFVRQEIEQSYKAQIEDALSCACSRPIVLQAVIGP